MSTAPSPFLNMGCTSFTWETKDHKHLFGRTYDQCGSLGDNRIAVVPRNFPLKMEIDSSSRQYIRTRYAFTGMAIIGLPSPVIIDGINENGVMGGLLNYPGYAVYDLMRDSRHMNIHPGFLTGFLLGQCANVEEIAGILPSLNLTNEPIFGCEMMVHYIFSDRSGETIIIEPDAQGLQVHRDTLGVMTNSPGYLWQQTNLCNYASISNILDPSRDYLDLKDHGASISSGGGFGLPGDYSSCSRFVRIAVFKHYAVKGEDEIDGISRMFRQFSTVEIPEGIILRSYTDPHSSQEQMSYDQTLCTSAMCAESNTYYFTTPQNRRISAIKLSGMEINPDIRYFDMSNRQDIAYLH